jgi:outer membrane lipoprotein SlyB
MKSKLLAMIVLASLGPACATTAMDVANPPPQPGYALYGQVASVNQTYEHVQGDPGGGALAGAVIGGVLGTALGGRGFGTFVGATEGAMIGAHASSGGYANPVFHVVVRFDDGSLRTFVYRNQLPFRPGEYVVWTAQGLYPR